jgi:hypothetical protein
MRTALKYILLIVLAVAAHDTNAQKLVRLRAVEPFDTPKKVHGIMYGNFVQRLAFSSGGYPQDIRILNVDSGRLYTFEVKKTFKSAKENTFCYYIAPGNYVILNYRYIQSKWYGGMEFLEPVNRAGADTLHIALNDSSHYPLEYKFRFTILPASVTYVGTWDFSDPQARFRDEREDITPLMQRKYKKIDFCVSRTCVPE